MQRLLVLCTAVLMAAIASPTALADAKTDQKLNESKLVFEAFSNLSENSIPTWLLERAYGIVIVPHVIKGAMILGGRGGKGVMSVRNPDGSWSNPVFVTLFGVNFGFQIGVQSTDVVLVLMSKKSVEGIGGGMTTLGGDMSVAAGPLGRAAAATTDSTFQAQVLSYARNEGLFAGIALDGTDIRIDQGSNELAYGVSGILPSQILQGTIATPPAAAVEFVNALTAATKPATAPAATAPTATAPASAEPKAPAATEPAAKTFPMEDQNPGAPPPK
ncbi:MAG TPA: lipid-binding SYLF domain-containing protein [Steroidobacteraceae bacterium]|nr:lipid-binding SYLF domain-containing protein [Steroidobacteraceae bacterium]